MTPGTTTEVSTPDIGSTEARRRFWQLSSSAGGIYGLLLVSGVIVVSRNFTGSSWEALLTVIGTLFIFFAAHAYASTLSEMSQHGLRFRDAIMRGMSESIGMIMVGLIPVLVLLLGVAGVLRPADAVWMALLVDVFLLALLGWGVTAARLLNVWARLGGALLAAILGGMIIVLKALIH